jgi:glycerophosphoryl diester phosphodiesterase
VCVHDTTVDRTTGGTHLGRVDQYTLAQLREMDFGTWFGPEFAGARIVTLEEQLTCYRGIDPSLQFYLETKAPSEYGGRMEPLLVDLLRRLNLVPKGEPDVRTSPVIIQSFDPGSLAAVHELVPSLPIALLTVAAPAADVTTIVDPDVVLPGAGVLATQPEIITTAHAENREVHTWTVDDPTIMRSLIQSGIDGFFTNDPAAGRATVDAVDRGSGRESQPEPSTPEGATATTATGATTTTEVERARGCPAGMGVGFVAAADRARSEEEAADDGVSPVVPIAIAAGLLIVVGVGGSLLVRRRRAQG